MTEPAAAPPSLQRLQEIRERLSSATPGPWRLTKTGWIDAGRYDEVIGPGPVECWSYCMGGTSTIDGYNLDADRALIANAPADIAYLLDRLARYETAFAGMWIAGDGDGNRGVWIDLGSKFGPTCLIRQWTTSAHLWAALAAVLPTEPPTQGAE